MTKINAIGVNYNYARFIRAHCENWQLLQASADGFLIVDDQSPAKDDDYAFVRDKFPGSFISTSHAKSRFNGVNQMRAIAFGLETLGVEPDSFYWVIDSDDIPLPTAIGDIRAEIAANDQMELFAFSRYEDEPGGAVSHPIKAHRFWLRNAPTSSLVVKGSVLMRGWSKLFLDKWFRDVWYDIRLSSLVPADHTLVSDKITHIKLSHDENDSLRYRHDRLEIAKRIFASLLYSVAVPHPK